MMDISRNQFFFAGLLCLLLGAQFYLIVSAELTPEFTQFLAERTGHPLAAVGLTTQALTSSDKSIVKKVIRPPEWLGCLLMSVGAVLVLHSWGMKKDG
jgi:drug/metabolite transporter (DMT)-like permease